MLYTAPSASSPGSGPNADGSSINTFTTSTTGLSVVWSLDTFTGLNPTSSGAITQDRELLFDTSILGGGSGNGDIYLMIPDTYFSSIASTDYIYLYAEFGGAGVINGKNYENSGGFEEFGRLSGLTFTSLPSNEIAPFNPAVIPESSSGSVVALGLATLGWRQVRRRRSASLAAA